MATVSDVVLSWFYRVLTFIIIIFIANIILLFIDDVILRDIVSFLNANIILIIFISLFFFIGSVVWFYGSPAYLLGPIFEALGSAFLVEFLMRLIVLIDRYVRSGIGELLASYAFYLELIVFILVLVFGYLSINKSRLPREEEIIETPIYRRRIIRRVRRRRSL